MLKGTVHPKKINILHVVPNLCAVVFTLGHKVKSRNEFEEPRLSSCKKGQYICSTAYMFELSVLAHRAGSDVSLTPHIE